MSSVPETRRKRTTYIHASQDGIRPVTQVVPLTCFATGEGKVFLPGENQRTSKIVREDEALPEPFTERYLSLPQARSTVTVEHGESGYITNFLFRMTPEPFDEDTLQILSHWRNSILSFHDS